MTLKTKPKRLNQASQESIWSEIIKFPKGKRGILFGKTSEHVLILLVTILFVTLIILLTNIFLTQSEKTEIVICGGTPPGECSSIKPYFCEQGILVQKASVCGCPGLSNISGETCISKYQLYPKEITLEYIDEGVNSQTNFVVYEELADHLSKISRAIVYEPGEVPSRADFKEKVINYEEQKKLLLPLVVKIQNSTNDSTEQARTAISIVQNIPYGSTETKIDYGNGLINYSKYPYEVLYHEEGICGEKSALMAFLLKELGYGTAIFYFAEENHEAVGIKCPIEKSFRNSGYCFVETGGPAVISDSSIEYAGDVKLQSNPEIIVISEGISLPENMIEYKDAKTLSQIRSGSVIGKLKMYQFDDLKERYGLKEVYQVG